MPAVAERSAQVRARTTEAVKRDAASVYAHWGMSLSDAINIFLIKSIEVGGLPFDVRQPRYNAETEAAIAEARDIMSGKVHAESYDSAAALFAALDEQ